mmetsp:Transcript_56706/g.130366  ORF Transcript_56706/g.130366 Transcript_56706/m.130366 type:complete len:271 (+) Transcript_56706:1469-2281(+)
MVVRRNLRMAVLSKPISMHAAGMGRAPRHGLMTVIHQPADFGVFLGQQTSETGQLGAHITFRRVHHLQRPHELSLPPPPDIVRGDTPVPRDMSIQLHVVGVIMPDTDHGPRDPTVLLAMALDSGPHLVDDRSSQPTGVDAVPDSARTAVNGVVQQQIIGPVTADKYYNAALPPVASGQRVDPVPDLESLRARPSYGPGRTIVPNKRLLTLHTRGHTQIIVMVAHSHHRGTLPPIPLGDDLNLLPDSVGVGRRRADACLQQIQQLRLDIGP